MRQSVLVRSPARLVSGGILGLMLAMSGCEVGPNYEPPKMPMPKGYSEATTRPTSREALADLTANEDQLKRWWGTFEDPELNSLVDRAIAGNLDIQLATERVREARALSQEAAAPLLPTLTGTGSYDHSRRSKNLGAGSVVGGSTGTTTGAKLENDLYQAGFDSSWEIDIFGGTRRGIESANAAVEAAQDNQQNVLVTLLGEVATDYVQVRGLQRQIEIAVENVDDQKQTLELIKTKARAGLVSQLNVAQQNAQVMSTEAVVPQLQQQVHQTIHALSVLMGEDPGALYDELSVPARIPTGPAQVPPGLPSDLLRRRPDIRAAERNLASANANVGVAIADWFPKFTLTGDLGVESSRTKNLFNYQSRFFDIGPNMSWPIFSGFQIEANIEVQKSLERQAFITYEQTVLTSLQEVDDGLIALAKEQDRREVLVEAVKANQQAVDLTRDLYKNGLGDFLSVLTAQDDLLTAQEQLAVSEETVSTNLVAVYKALGGGWDVPKQ